MGCGGSSSYSRAPNTELDGGVLGGAGGQSEPGTASGGMTASGGVGAEGGRGAVAGTGGTLGSGGAGGTLAATGGTSAGGRTGMGGRAEGSGGVIATGGNGGRPAGSGGVSSGGAGGGGSTGSGGAAATGGAGMGGGPAGGAGGNGVGGRGSGAGAGGNGNGNGGSGTGGQRILSIDFVGGEASSGAGGLTGAVPMAPSEIAGVKPAKNWNSAAGPMGTLSSLVMADSTVATGATATWTAPTYAGAVGVLRIGYTDAPGDVRMMNGCLNPSWTSQTSGPVTAFTMSNLPATVNTGAYDVYVYVLGGIPDPEARTYQYTIGTTTFNVNQMGPTPTAVATPYLYVRAPDKGSGNYIVFRQVTGASFTLTVRAGNSTGTFRSPINGIQLVWPTGS